MGIFQVMFIGFDYGTANCSVAVMRDNLPQLLTLENGSKLLPSMLSAPTREAVSEWLYRHHDVPTNGAENQALLRRAINYNRDEDIDVLGNSVQFGLASLHQYVDDPEEVYFVKSPKSFLGASGLKPQQVALFEDLVCAMMLHIKQQAQTQLPETIDQAVIGRPINFQGLGGDDANAQAQGILERAAKRAGFRDVVFQFEPVAAGLDFEATLTEATGSMVVDIGGGTTEVGVISLGGMVYAGSVRVGGDKLDEAIINYISRNYGMMIGENTSENIKKTIGSAFPGAEVKEMEVSGINKAEGIPRKFTISSNEILEALTDPLNQIVSAVKSALEKTPPELGADIAEKGMVLTGGGALLRDLDRLLMEETGLPVIVADEPLTCVARGCGMALEKMDKLASIFASD